MSESTFITESIDENINGVVMLNQLIMSGFDITPPKNGPSIKPSPKAAPMSPKFLALSLFGVRSAIAA